MQSIVYHFRFADGHSESFDGQPVVSVEAGSAPEWSRLGNHQCPNCPLSPDSTPYCPMALQFVNVINKMGAMRSYDSVTVQVDSPERSVTKATTLQRAIGSLMGLLAANSACPRVNFLKPMANFHLPFATEEETICRVASLYLLTQYFLQRRGEVPDLELTGLKAHYQELQTVNAAMAKRIRAASEGDGAINALVLLDLLAKALPYSIDDALEEVKGIFDLQAI